MAGGGKTEEDGSAKVLLKETKEQQSEVKSEMARMIRKLDDLSSKVSDRRKKKNKQIKI